MIGGAPMTCSLRVCSMDKITWERGIKIGAFVILLQPVMMATMEIPTGSIIANSTVLNSLILNTQGRGSAES